MVILLKTGPDETKPPVRWAVAVPIVEGLRQVASRIAPILPSELIVHAPRQYMKFAQACQTIGQTPTT
jgi:hypothetical protein